MKHLEPEKKLAFVLRNLRGEPKVELCKEAKIGRPTLDEWLDILMESAEVIFARNRLLKRLRKLEAENKRLREGDVDLDAQVAALNQGTLPLRQSEDLPLADEAGNLDWVKLG